jgi:Bifunctional DNA primase/polymerase, N-terminal/FaeA-like protein
MTARPQSALDRRRQLLATGFSVLPLYGKEPPNKGNNKNKRRSLTDWQQLGEITDEMLVMWSKTWPDAQSTGILTRTMPTLDVDILNEEAACACEDHVREQYEEKGPILVRIGKPPKRAIPFRTIEPFAKFVVNLTAPNGAAEKIEFLADGAQVAAFGIHPETKQPYRWHGGVPGEIKLEELPYIREDAARTLVDELVQILVERFSYTRAKERPGKRKSKDNGQDAADEADRSSAPADWQFLIDNILAGRALHDSLRDLAAKMSASGMNAGAAVNALRGMMDGATCPHDDRWRERRDEIPRLVDSAAEKYAKTPEPEPSEPAPMPLAIADTLKVFEHWLLLKDHTPVLAVLACIAANYLPGDPVWLAVIAPPSSAKTEILNATVGLPNVVRAATLTPAGLLSGTPKKQQAKGAKGGLLQQIGDFGILAFKDFGSILSMHPETKAETLAALREVYDGSWTRHLGSDGGRTLHWQGKVGLITAATGVIDSHYSVIGAMGDRFLFSRLAPTPGRAQFNRALDHVGDATKQMRGELAEAVVRLFAGRKKEPRPIGKDEAGRLGEVISLVVRLRGAVARDRRSNEIEAIYGAEGTARIGLALERLLAGLDTLGVERERAMGVVLAVGLDSCPPLRRAAYQTVEQHRTIKTADVAIALGLPTETARRILEDLAAYGLVTRESQGQGKADLWHRAPWEAAQ